MKKKSLIGWVEKNWFMTFYKTIGRYEGGNGLDKTEFFFSHVHKPKRNNKDKKVRITIEEI